MIQIEAVEREDFQFDRRYFFFCMHSAVQQLLRFYRVPHAELMIDAGWSCWLDSEGALRLDMEPLIKSRRAWYRIEFCQSPEDYARLWRSNIDTLKRGRPVILGADYFFLPFHPRYHKQHGAHAVLLYGADIGEANGLGGRLQQPLCRLFVERCRPATCGRPACRPTPGTAGSTAAETFRPPASTS